MSANSVWELKLLAKVQDQQHINLFHYRMNALLSLGTPGASACTDLAENWYEQVWPLIAPAFHTTWKLEVIQVKQILGAHLDEETDRYVTTYNAQFIKDIPPDEGQGELTGDATPTFVAIGYQKLTDRPGRTFRGNFRISPTVESMTTDNALNATGLGLYDDNEEAFLHTVDDGNTGANVIYEMCVWSPKFMTEVQNPVDAFDAKAATAKVTGLRLNPYTTSQVSRKQRPII